MQRRLSRAVVLPVLAAAVLGALWVAWPSAPEPSTLVQSLQPPVPSVPEPTTLTAPHDAKPADAERGAEEALPKPADVALGSAPATKLPGDPGSPQGGDAVAVTADGRALAARRAQLRRQSTRPLAASAGRPSNTAGARSTTASVSGAASAASVASAASAASPSGEEAAVDTASAPGLGGENAATWSALGEAAADPAGLDLSTIKRRPPRAIDKQDPYSR